MSILKPPESKKIKRKTRRCLACGKRFLSTWIGNRLCKKCRDGSSTWWTS